MFARRDFRTVCPLFIYLILSCLFFGRGLVGHLGDRYIGVGSDPGAFIFFLEWWKYVFSHHVNPFLTYLQWAPSGANMAWATCIPLFGIAVIPLTATLGPIVTFNLLVLVFPAIAAWTAFLLCRYLSSSFWAAVLGGYVFGFSPWMLGQLLAHLTVLMIFPAPLMVLATMRRLSGERSARTFTITLSVLLVTQFLCWPEAVAVESLFGGVAIAIAWLTAPQWRERLQGLIFPAICAYVASALVLSPYLYYFFALEQIAFPGGLKGLFSVQPSELLVPTTTILLGTPGPVRAMSRGSNIFETGAYIALPMLIIVMDFARRNWRDWRTRLLVTILLVICAASLGSELKIGTFRPIPLPWAIAAHLPLIDKALPARFSLYCFLILGIILSLWLSDYSIRKNLRAAGAGALILFTVPNLNSAYWTTPINSPAFFSARLYVRYLSPEDNVLTIPYGIEGNSDIWQATSGMYFRMAGGWVGQPPIPSAYLPYFPILYDFLDRAESPFAGEMLKAFLVQKHVNAIVVADQGAQIWKDAPGPGPRFPQASEFSSIEKAAIHSLFAPLGVAPIEVGGVSFYKVPLERLEAYKNVNPRDLEKRTVSVQLDTLIEAAAKYISDGHPLSDLTLGEVQRSGLLPARWVSSLDLRSPMQHGLALSSLKNGDVLIGVIGARGTIESLANDYRPYAKKIDISSLMGLGTSAESTRWILLLDCDREQLARAAEIARRRNLTQLPVVQRTTAVGEGISLTR
jgi:hypothetical protein